MCSSDLLRVLRPLLKSLAVPRREPVLAPPAHTMAAEQTPQISNFSQTVDHAKQIARNDPKIVANVVKEWVAGNGS